MALLLSAPSIVNKTSRLAERPSRAASEKKVNACERENFIINRTAGTVVARATSASVGKKKTEFLGCRGRCRRKKPVKRFYRLRRLKRLSVESCSRNSGLDWLAVSSEE